MAIDTRLLFATPHEVARDAQERLIEFVREEGEPSHPSYSTGPEPCWIWQSLTLPKTSVLPPEVRRWFEGKPPSQFDIWSFYSRLDPGLEWEWLPGQASGIVRSMLEPVTPLFRKLTRVKVLLQIPGQGLRAHRDLIAGNVYDTMSSELDYAWGSERLRYKGLPWLEQAAPVRNASHRDNLYLSMKIPVSDSPGDAGLPYVVVDGEKLHYSTQDRIFFLNEAEVLHGADPVSHWRGVVFVTGLWDLEALSRLPRLPVAVLGRSPAA